MTRDDLVAFEESIAAQFNAGLIKYPVHLESGNEDALIEIFQDVKPADWVFVSWRGHLKALLKGVPREDLKAAIHRGESMALRFPEHRVYGSAIVGGTGFFVINKSINKAFEPDAPAPAGNDTQAALLGIVAGLGVSVGLLAIVQRRGKK